MLGPSEIPYKANIYALKKLGAQWCLSVSAVGSLQEVYAPGHLVIPDQIIDRTKGRDSTFFGSGIVAHIPFADPYCPVMSKALFEVSEKVAREFDVRVDRGGTYLCMEGPQFSTRAESQMYRAWGASVIGMTGLPEAKLAREAEMAYATLAMVTDYDCWRSNDSDINIEEILATMKKNVSIAKAIIPELALRLTQEEPSEMAANALATAIVSDKSKIPAETREKLELIIGRYL
jgi:5'-methylthioadenosine phosphorylase